MSEEPNDSPAFRLRPRRGAPKSYYTVRLEYSANPAAFIRERPKIRSKKRTFTQKTGSSSSSRYNNINNNSQYANDNGRSQADCIKPTIVTKEEQERDARRMMLRRDVSESITTDVMISPFLQRLQLNELKPDTTYQHNYVTVRIKDIVARGETDEGGFLICSCRGVDDSQSTSSTSPQANYSVIVRLHGKYADESLVKPEKYLSIAKFRTAPASNIDSHITSTTTTTTTTTTTAETTTTTTNNLTIIVRVDPQQLIIPFVSITDMIEPPEEPYVEMVHDEEGDNGGANSPIAGEDGKDHKRLKYE